ncbi:MAG TPA: hypothetical protein VGG61_12130 [Gemmataceae bacterium]|jgi:hypothetical protein
MAANLLCGLSVALYASSFFLPTFAIVVDGKRCVSYGAEGFFIGLFAPIASPFFGGVRTFFPWLANPIWWFALVRFTQGRATVACIAGIAAPIVALSLLFFADSEGRNLILIGYYVWILSMAILPLAAGMKWHSYVEQQTFDPPSSIRLQ